MIFVVRSADSLVLLGQVMLDTVGPELQVVNKRETPISLEENGTVILTPHQGQEASSNLLPINFSGLAKVTTLMLFFSGVLHVRLVCTSELQPSNAASQVLLLPHARWFWS